MESGPASARPVGGHAGAIGSKVHARGLSKMGDLDISGPTGRNRVGPAFERPDRLHDDVPKISPEPNTMQPEPRITREQLCPVSRQFKPVQSRSKMMFEMVVIME